MSRNLGFNLYVSIWDNLYMFDNHLEWNVLLLRRDAHGPTQT